MHTVTKDWYNRDIWGHGTEGIDLTKTIKLTNQLSDWSIKLSSTNFYIETCPIKPRGNYVLPIAVAARSKACVYGLSLAETSGSNPAGDTKVCLSCVLPGWCLCDGSITLPEEMYRVWWTWAASGNLGLGLLGLSSHNKSYISPTVIFHFATQCTEHYPGIRFWPWKRGW